MQVAADRLLESMENSLEMPWEYVSGSLARSFLPVEVMCGVPFAIARVGFASDLSTALFLLKMWMFLLSILGDLLVVIIAKRFSEVVNWRWVLVVRSTSWASVVFATRTFSNVLEALLLDALMVVWLGKDRVSLQGAFVGGVLIGLGFFARITFPAFGAVIGLDALRTEILHAVKKEGGELVSKRVFIHVVKFSAMVACGMFVAMATQIAIDSRLNGRFVVAPIANVMYNIKPSNLEKHGLHPIWTHAIVNLQILFGPLGPIALFRLLTHQIKTRIEITLAAAVLVPLGLLSLFPHQEFRFLFPLFTPLLLLGAQSLRQDTSLKTRIVPRILFAVWIVFNLALGWLMGTAHQAGVTEGVQIAAKMCRDASPSSKRCCLVGRKVYMLPTYLLGDQIDRFKVMDQQRHDHEGSNHYEDRLGNCDIALILGPAQDVLNGNDNGGRRVVWRYEGFHFNSEAGGLVDLVIVKSSSAGRS